ncbi:putative ATPase [Bradyrhizobium sp. GM6.1]
MRPTDIAISNYRSIRRLSIPIHPLSVFVGENGVGKSNLYKSLSLLRDAATGQITRTIADEGGLNSVCWSGIRKRGEDGRLRLSATFDGMRYSIELGFPSPLQAAFSGEPMIKAETIETTRGKRTVKLMERIQFAHQRPRREWRLERSQGCGAAVRDRACGFFRWQAMPGNRPDQKCNAGLAILS